MGISIDGKHCSLFLISSTGMCWESWERSNKHESDGSNKWVGKAGGQKSGITSVSVRIIHKI